MFFKTPAGTLAIVPLAAGGAAASRRPDALRSSRAPAQGSVEVSDRSYLYAASPGGHRAIVLLRAAKPRGLDWQPFTIAFAIAAASAR